MEVKFTDNSNKLIAALTDEALPRALLRIGFEAEGYAKDLAPYITGFLRNSITFAISGQGAQVQRYKADKPNDSGVVQSGSYSGTAPAESKGAALYLGSNLNYAAAKELGTSRSVAVPYLKPAISQHGQTYKNILEDELKNT